MTLFRLCVIVTFYKTGIVKTQTFLKLNFQRRAKIGRVSPLSFPIFGLTQPFLKALYACLTFWNKRISTLIHQLYQFWPIAKLWRKPFDKYLPKLNLTELKVYSKLWVTIDRCVGAFFRYIWTKTIWHWQDFKVECNAKINFVLLLLLIKARVLFMPTLVGRWRTFSRMCRNRQLDESGDGNQENFEASLGWRFTDEILLPFLLHWLFG